MGEKELLSGDGRREPIPGGQNADHLTYLGLVFGAVQAAGALLGLSLPKEITIPLMLLLAFGCLSFLVYRRAGVGSSAFRLSVAGFLFAALTSAISPVASRLLTDLASGPREADMYHVGVSVFGDTNANGVKDLLERPLTHIMVRLYQSDRLGNQGIYPKETDDDGVAQLSVPRPGHTVLRICGETQQITIDTSSTSPARSHQVSIGIPPWLMERCEKP